MFQCRFQVSFVRNQHLRGSRWSGRSQISGEVGQRDIGFVPHCADDRQSAPSHSPNHPLVVKSPEVLYRVRLPRPRMITSTSSVSQSLRIALVISYGALSPCTEDGLTTMFIQGPRCRMIRIISRTTAPRGEVTKPMVFGKGGNGFFRL